MNTYMKYCHKVFVAKCSEEHEKGEKIILTTKYGHEHECIVFNNVGITKDGSFCYSIVRADGFNHQEFAKRRAERLKNAALNAEKKSNSYWEASSEGADFLALGEPIKVGHHSEKRHRALIERNHDKMSKAVELSKKSQEYENRVAYWDEKANTINLSMPESLEYYEFKLENAIEYRDGLKNGTIARDHVYSLTYATKAVKELQSKVEIASLLWS